MKKIVVLFCLIFISISCELDDDKRLEFYMDLVPVETKSLKIPNVFVQGQTYQIVLKYKKPSVCHFPDGVYYFKSEEEANTRIVAVKNIVFEGDNCSNPVPEEDLEQEEIFEFKATQPAKTVYIFKFLQGKNANGTPNYLIIEVPVVDKIEVPVVDNEDDTTSRFEDSDHSDNPYPPGAARTSDCP